MLNLEKKPNLYLILLSFSTYIFIHTTTDTFQFLAGEKIEERIKKKEEELKKHVNKLIFLKIFTLVYCTRTTEVE